MRRSEATHSATLRPAREPDSLDGMYPLLFRTVLSRMDPETAHHAAMVVIRLLGIPPFSWAARALTAARTRARDRRALGLDFASPFGVAAGFDKDVRAARGLYALGFGHVEVGTLTAIAQHGNPRPRLFRLIPDRAVDQPHGLQQPAAPRRPPRRLAKLRRRPHAAGDRRQHRQEPRRRRRRRDRRLRRAARRCSRRSPTTSSSTCRRRTPRASAACRRSRRFGRCSRRCGMPRAARRCSSRSPPTSPTTRSPRSRASRSTSASPGLIATNTTISREGLATDPAVVAAAGAGGLSGAPLQARALEVLRLVRAVVPAEFCVISVGRRRDGRRRAGAARGRRHPRAGLHGVPLPRPALGAADQPGARPARLTRAAPRPGAGRA